MLDNIDSLLVFPLANVTPNSSHFGSTIPRGVTQLLALRFANKVACHVTDYAGQHALTHCQHCFDSCTRIHGCTAMYLSTVCCL